MGNTYTREQCIADVCPQNLISRATEDANENRILMPGLLHLCLASAMVWVSCVVMVAAFSSAKNTNFRRSLYKFTLLHAKGVSNIQGLLVCSVLICHVMMAHKHAARSFAYQNNLGQIYDGARQLQAIHDLVESAWSYVSSSPLINVANILDHLYKFLSWTFLVVSFLPCYLLVRRFFDSNEKVDDVQYEFTIKSGIWKLIVSFLIAFGAVPLLFRLGIELLQEYLEEIKAPSTILEAVENVAKNNTGPVFNDIEDAKRGFVPPSVTYPQVSSLRDRQRQQSMSNVDADPVAPAQRSQHSYSGSDAKYSRRDQDDGVVSQGSAGVHGLLSNTAQFLFGSRSSRPQTSLPLPSAPERPRSHETRERSPDRSRPSLYNPDLLPEEDAAMLARIMGSPN